MNTLQNTTYTVVLTHPLLGSCITIKFYSEKEYTDWKKYLEQFSKYLEQETAK